MAKVDYKKQFKSLYLPKKQPEIMAVPPLRFAMLDGQGDPNGGDLCGGGDSAVQFQLCGQNIL